MALALVQVPEGTLGCRYFQSYTGSDIPPRLIGEMVESQVTNRNTYIRAWYDEKERLTGLDQLVNGAVELTHRYTYADGEISRAEIKSITGRVIIVEFEDDDSTEAAE